MLINKSANVKDRDANVDLYLSCNKATESSTHSEVDREIGNVNLLLCQDTLIVTKKKQKVMIDLVKKKPKRKY